MKGIDDISGATHDDSARIRELPKAFDAVMSTHAAHADSAECEGGQRPLHGAGVDRRAARMCFIKYPIGRSGIVAEHVQAQWSLTGVDGPDGLIKIGFI